MRIRDELFVIGELDPGDIVTVAGPVIEAEDSTEILSKSGDIGKGLIASGRVFDQDHLQAVAVQVKGLHPSEGGMHSGETVDGFLSGEPEADDRCYGSGGIINIVDGRKRDADLFDRGFPAGPHADHRALGRGLFDGSNCHIGAFAVIAAFCAAEAAQVGVDVVVVFVFTAALGAFAGVGKIHLSLGSDSLLKAVPHDFVGNIDRKRGRERIFRIEGDDRFGTALDACADLL